MTSVDRLDWAGITAQLDELGCAIAGSVLGH